ncbi:hypothetical protein AB6A40_005501 [Gnathostoma spinigerum]|uniref:beta-ketoacyl-[acyl-carrier-protein] synthase I n=1 Tax=Gnathostoma spinigerum TaxID=75299 RepID=A0ABD6EHU4_9BILA
MFLSRVVVTGIGVVSPYGIGKEVLFDGLRLGKSALKMDSTLGTVVGRIPEGTAKHELCLEKWRKGDLREMSRGSLLSLIAAEEALNDARLNDVDMNETGVDVGMGIADLDLIAETAKLIENGKSRRVTPYFVPRILTNMPAGHISIRYGLKGANMSSCTACATGLHAVGNAATLIATGRSRRMLAGATEACVNAIAVTGFRRLRALSSTNSRPFDKDRDGFILSEGAAILVLERLDDALERKANIYAEVNGYGLSGDAYHLTSPEESGIGAVLSMERCMRDSRLKMSDITYVNAHATSTPLGDKAEAHAIAKLMPGMAVSSIKGHIGHTLAAAGAIEAAVVAMCIREGTLVGNLNLKETDIDEKLCLLRETEPWKGQRNAMINSFGFGGPHCTLCLSQL